MATLYLSTTGSDTYTYAQAQSPTTPWLTIGKVASSAVNGDTVYVADGTYTIPPGQTTWTVDINWVATNELGAIFDGNLANFVWKNRTVTFWGIKWINVLKADNEGMFNGADVVFTRCQLGEHTYPLYLAGTSTTGSLNRNGGVGFDTCLVYAEMNTGAGGKDCAFIYSNPSNSQWTAGKTWKNSTFIFNGTTIGTGQFSSILGASGSSTGVKITITDCILYAGNTALPWEVGNWIDTNIDATYSGFYQITTPPSGTGTLTTDPLFYDIANGNVKPRPTSDYYEGGTTV